MTKEIPGEFEIKYSGQIG